MAKRPVDKGDPSAGGFAIQEYLYYLVAQAMDRYELGIEEVLRPIGFNKTRWRILMSLREQDGASISAISDMTSIRRSTTSRAVEQMEKEGLVARRPSRKDNRVTEVYLRPQGVESLDRIVSVTGRQYRRSIEGLPESDLEIMRESLRRIIRNLKRSPIE